MSSIVRRLTVFSKSEVEHLFAHASCVYKDAGVTILSAPQQKLFGRALIITPRKIGNAPQRNKIRRHIKSIFYQFKLYECGFDFAFIIRAPLLKQSFDELKALCLRVCNPAH